MGEVVLTSGSKTLGAMIAMSTTMTLKGAIKFSLKKLIAGGEIAHSQFTGPGELLLAPATLGDITTIRFSGNDTWNVGRDAFLAATQGIIKEYKSQSIGKAIFSGEGLFVYKISGKGILWISSFGAVIRKDVCCFVFLALLLFGSPVAHFSSCLVYRIPADRILLSYKKAKDTSSIITILWPGTAST